MDTYHCIVLVVLHVAVVESQTSAELRVENVPVTPGDTAIFQCSFFNITPTSSLEIKKNNGLIYSCGNIAFPCTKLSASIDYSDVTFMDIGTLEGKGTFTVANANQTRDGGNWTCTYEFSSTSDIFYFDMSVPATTVPAADSPISESECSQCCYYWLFLLMLIPCVGLVVVIIIVSRYKTLVISTLYVKVTKNTVQLSWKPEFEPVPHTAYAKCGPNGLTENAELIDGLFVVVFRELTPERQHDVTIYCQNPADMKLYKSETCVVFSLKDSSNTNPKECNPVLALHSLDLSVYQRKVELSWTSPLAFDSTKVEYWVGSDKHITISANKPSPATSIAEMTRLLPGRMITFTITGEKDGTKYPSGILHQKTLKGLTDCCP